MARWSTKIIKDEAILCGTAASLATEYLMLYT